MSRQPTLGGSIHPVGAKAARPDRRAVAPFAAGLAASAVLHLFVLQIPFNVRVEGMNTVDPRRSSSVAGQSSLQLLQITIDEDITSSAEEQIRKIPPISPLIQADIALSTAVTVPDQPASVAPEALSLRDRLRSTIPLAPVKESASFGAESALAVAKDRVAHELHSYNDSVALADEAARKSRDWTRTNDRGERWGISVARLHLGRFSVALQYDTTEDVFRAPFQRREEYQKRILLFRETDRQLEKAEIDAQIRASLREIRSRTDARRDSIRRRGR